MLSWCREMKTLSKVFAYYCIDKFLTCRSSKYTVHYKRQFIEMALLNKKCPILPIKTETEKK